MKKVCIVGAESTGKTTIGGALATHYRTELVPEFARIYLEDRGGLRRLESMAEIARGQVNSEDSLGKRVREILICDGCPLSTVIWSRHYFHHCDEEILELAEKYIYDLYLVTDVDCPWVRNGLRNAEPYRQPIHREFLEELAARELPCVILSGWFDQRLSRAKESIDIMLAS